MSAKRSSASSRIISALAGAAAAFAARRLIFFGWKQITGKEPPEHSDHSVDSRVGLPESLLFGIILGAGVHTARVLASRAATRHTSDTGADGPPV
jgi:hypothetical protein